MALKAEEVYAILKKQMQSGGGTPGTPGRGIEKIELTDTQGLIDTYTITYTDGATTTYTVTNGEDGEIGATPNIQIGTVQTLEPGQDATASMSGTPENPLLNLGIPKGEKGDPEASHIFPNAGSHNSIYRGNNLGSSVTQEQWNAIEAGTFDDLYIGDYWVIDGVNWRIAAFDYYLNCGDTSFAKHHAVIVPDTSLYSHNMNDTNTTVGAYVGSGMYTEGLEQAKTQIQNAFGASHVLSHRLLLTSTTTNGYASSGEWKDSIVDLMCENMVYGTMISSPMSNGTNIPYNYRVEKGQLPLFSMAPQYTFVISQPYWLRDVVSASSFATAASRGHASNNGASNIFGVRPAFCIGI